MTAKEENPEEEKGSCGAPSDIPEDKMRCIPDHAPLQNGVGVHGPLGGHNHKPKERKTLVISMVITGVVMLVEIVGGIITNSLALISDGSHMFTHLTALAVSYIAILIAAKEKTDARSFGLYRAEIVSALFNGFLILVVTFLIIQEAYHRIISPEVIQIQEMIGIALLGLAVNLVVAFLLSKTDHEHDLNIKGAFIHMVADTLSSVAIIGGAVVIFYTGWYVVDALLSLIIAVVILAWVVNLFKDAVGILMEFTPPNVDIGILKETLTKEIPSIEDIHDVHVWTITQGMIYFTSHVVLQDCSLHQTEKVRERMGEILREKFGISHTTIQFECPCVFPDPEDGKHLPGLQS